MSSEAIEHDAGEALARRWREACTWTGLLATAFVVYELTRQPALGTAALCLKFAWDDFKTARWLRRVDPWRSRGRACWWLYVGGGFWRMAGIALLTNLVTIVAILLLGPPGPGPAGPAVRLMGSFLAAAATALIGYSLAGAAVAVAVMIARKHRIKLWLNGSVRSARRWGIWPPPANNRPRRNWLVIVLLSSAFPLEAVLVICECILLYYWRVPFPEAITACTAGLLLAIFAAACIEIGRRHAALFPSYCWPPEQLGEWREAQAD